MSSERRKKDGDFGKPKPKTVEIRFCTASSRITATAEHVDTGDNNFHCPITGSWVSLTRTPDGTVVCSRLDCNNNERQNSDTRLSWFA